MPEQPSNFSTVQAEITADLITTIRTVTNLSAEDIPFHRSLDRSVAKSLDTRQKDLLSIVERLLKSASSSSSSSSSSNDHLPSLVDGDGIEIVENNWRQIVEVLDGILERADACLDEFRPLHQRNTANTITNANSAITSTSTTTNTNNSLPQTPRTPLESPFPASPSPYVAGRTKPAFVPRNLNIAKPQLLFDNVPKNDESGPFHPLLSSKPNAIISLEESLKLTELNTQTNQPEYKHPYETEIKSYNYPKFAQHEKDSIIYHPFESTKAIFVNTEEALAEMLKVLVEAKEIAIDLEHHDNRSYIGIVSLMQISTRDQDWVVDTLKPWRRNLECLNQVFTNPSILKVFHGAQSDIIWLQRDLGLYVVGLFDTYHACRALRYPGASLAFLLKRFCNVDAQKQYQTADWRMRPLPQEMLDYARSDTHFLLYIYDMLRNELVTTTHPDEPSINLLQTVLENSKETSLLRYEYPVYDEKTGLGIAGWYKLVARTPAIFNRVQFAVFRAVHFWRDLLARSLDESLIYILQNHALFAIAREIPEEKSAVFRVVAPMSPVVRMRVDELVSVINKAIRNSDKELEMRTSIVETEELLASYKLSRYGLKSENLSGDKLEAKIEAKSEVSSQITGTAMEIDDEAVTEDKDKNKDNDSKTSGASGQAVLEPTTSSSSSSSSSSENSEAFKLSKFWGELANVLPVLYHSDKLDFPLPLPDLTAEVFTRNRSPGIESQLLKPEYIPTEDRTPLESDDVFIVKQLGGRNHGKRKRPVDITSPSTIQIDGAEALEEMDLNDIEDDQFMTKEDRKNKKREDKRRRKELGLQTKRDRQSEVEEFDYGAAPSLMGKDHGGSALGMRNNKKGKKKGGIDMYSKAMDAPKGLGRSNKQRAGLSGSIS